MPFLQLIEQFLADMRASKTRTFLSVFAIAWGTVAVVMLVALGNAFHDAAREQMKDVGENLVEVWPMRTTKPFAGLNAGRQLPVRCTDVTAMAQAIPEIALASPKLKQYGVSVSYDTSRYQASSVTAVSPDYGAMRNLVPEPGGRFLNEQDMERRRRVVFIGNWVRVKLFGDEDGVGKTITIAGRPFQVVGNLKSKGNQPNSGSFSTVVMIPYTTHIAIWGDRVMESFVLRPNPPTASEPMIEAVRSYMSDRYRFDPADEGVLGIYDMAESARFTNWFFTAVTSMFGLGGLLTLGAGGVGVANVLFLSVRERTREIGVRMAVGAQPRNILHQFLLEAGLMVAMGGGAGLAFSAFVIGILRRVALPDWIAAPELSPLVGLMTVAVLATVALCAGLFPARRASRLDPVQALEA